MSGRVVFIPQQPHDCDHPPDGSHPTWTRWDCDDCDERWIVLPSFPGDEPVGMWARWPHDKKPQPRLASPYREVRAWRWPWRRK